MDVRSRSEVGLKNVDIIRDMRPKPADNPAGLPGTADTDRQARDFQKGSQSVMASQAKDSFKVVGSQVDMIG
ncbi:MAG: hypothetical protein JNM27_22185 [Leptospirales bacterium]|nr:hypothetical protein [Leptospirales bacterium]